MAGAARWLGDIPAGCERVDLVLELGGDGSGAVVGCALALSVRLFRADDVGLHTAALLQHATFAGEPNHRSAHPQPGAGLGDDAARSRGSGWGVWPLARWRRRSHAVAWRLHHRLPLPCATARLRRAASADGSSVWR